MNSPPQARASHLQALLLALLLVTVLGAFLLIRLHGFIASKGSAASVDLIVDNYRHLMAPEPAEQFAFAVLAALVPVLALVLSLIQTRSSFACSERAGVNLPIMIAGLSLWTVFGSDFVPTVTRDFRKPYLPVDTGTLLAALLTASLLCTWWTRRSKPSIKARHASTGAAWALFLIAVLLQVASWRIVSFASVLSDSPPWEGHADPLFYVMAQVHGGKTLLADLPSQYGLFAEMLNPIFRVVGLTVATVSLLFGLLQVISLAGLFFVLEKFVRSRQLLTIAGLALVLLTFGTVLINVNYEDRYFQNWPLRIFWPAISVVAFYWFSQRPSYLRAGSFSAIGAIALLWNLESGLFISVAFGSYLLARAVVGKIAATEPAAPDAWWPRDYFITFAAHISITAAVVAVFMAALTFKAGQPLHFRWLFEYQRIFADLGLAMLPLPREPHPWMAVLAVYLGAMLQAFLRLKRGERTGAKADTLFYLGMLGLGLFVYYVGRSHVLNLVTVCWPAVMLIAICADEIVRMIRAKAAALPAIAIAIVSCAMLLVAAGSFVVRLPSFVERTWLQFTTRGQSGDLLAGNELSFIKRHARPGSQCLILAQRQGIYHAEAEVASPFEGPGLIEMVLIADQRRMMDEVFAHVHPCLFVGVGPHSVPNLQIDLQKVLEAYVIADQSPGGTMLYLNPRSGGGEKASGADAKGAHGRVPGAVRTTEPSS